MPRYWVFDHFSMLGPKEALEVMELPGLTRDTLVNTEPRVPTCLPLSRFPELDALFQFHRLSGEYRQQLLALEARFAEERRRHEETSARLASLQTEWEALLARAEASDAKAADLERSLAEDRRASEAHSVVGAAELARELAAARRENAALAEQAARRDSLEAFGAAEKARLAESVREERRLREAAQEELRAERGRLLAELAKELEGRKADGLRAEAALAGMGERLSAEFRRALEARGSELGRERDAAAAAALEREEEHRRALSQLGARHASLLKSLEAGWEAEKASLAELTGLERRALERLRGEAREEERRLGAMLAEERAGREGERLRAEAALQDLSERLAAESATALLAQAQERARLAEQAGTERERLLAEALAQERSARDEEARRASAARKDLEDRFAAERGRTLELQSGREQLLGRLNEELTGRKDDSAAAGAAMRELRDGFAAQERQSETRHAAELRSQTAAWEAERTRLLEAAEAAARSQVEAARAAAQRPDPGLTAQIAGLSGQAQALERRLAEETSRLERSESERKRSEEMCVERGRLLGETAQQHKAELDDLRAQLRSKAEAWEAERSRLVARPDPGFAADTETLSRQLAEKTALLENTESERRRSEEMHAEHGRLLGEAVQQLQAERDQLKAEVEALRGVPSGQERHLKDVQAQQAALLAEMTAQLQSERDALRAELSVERQARAEQEQALNQASAQLLSERDALRAELAKERRAAVPEAPPAPTPPRAGTSAIDELREEHRRALADLEKEREARQAEALQAASALEGLMDRLHSEAPKDPGAKYDPEARAREEAWNEEKARLADLAELKLRRHRELQDQCERLTLELERERKAHKAAALELERLKTGPRKEEGGPT